MLWDEAIHLYEAEEFPGDYDELNVEVENWYTYRSILSERLELVLQMLAEKQFDFSQIEEEEEEDIENQLRAKYQQSNRLQSSKIYLRSKINIT